MLFYTHLLKLPFKPSRPFSIPDGFNFTEFYDVLIYLDGKIISIHAKEDVLLFGCIDADDIRLPEIMQPSDHFKGRIIVHGTKNDNHGSHSQVNDRGFRRPIPPLT